MIPERCSSAAHLFIGVATHTGWVACETMASIAIGMTLLGKAGVGATLGIMKGAPSSDHAYNCAVTEFLKSNASDLLIVDYDIGTPPDSFVRIAMSDRPFVVGAYPKRKTPIEWTVNFPNNLIKIDHEGYAYPDLAPAGFMRLHRSVFDVMPCVKYLDEDGETVYGYFRNEIREGEQYGLCDRLFCREWLSRGGTIAQIADLSFTHSGMNVWGGNFYEYAKQLAEQTVR